MKKPPASVTTIDPADTLPSTGTRDPAVRCDLKEAAAMLFTSPGTLRYRIEQGLLSVIYEGDKMDITRSEILRYGRTSHPDPVRGKSKKTKNGRERYVYLNSTALVAFEELREEHKRLNSTSRRARVSRPRRRKDQKPLERGSPQPATEGRSPRRCVAYSSTHPRFPIDHAWGRLKGSAEEQGAPHTRDDGSIRSSVTGSCVDGPGGFCTEGSQSGTKGCGEWFLKRLPAVQSCIVGHQNRYRVVPKTAAKPENE
jgi:hypothetical protein